MTAEAPVNDPLLERPGVMRASWWLRCRGCGALVHGPGDHERPCPCDTWHPVGDVVGLIDLPDGRAWVCRVCLVAQLPDALAAGPVPEQRRPPVRETGPVEVRHPSTPVVTCTWRP